MIKRMLLTGLFLSATIALGVAQALTVTYVDGTVEVQSGKTWKALNVGTSVAVDAQVRVSDQGSVEFTRGARHFSIIKDGTYSVADLLKNSAKSGQAGVGANLAMKLHSVATGGGQSSTAVGGVRGAAQGDNSQNLTWMGDEDDTAAKAQALLLKERYREAESEIKQALADSQDDQKKQDLSYLLAAAYYGEGQGVRAYRALVALNYPSSGTYYPDSVILRAQILLDNQEYSDSLQALKDFLAGSPDTQYAQVADLLSAQCYKGLGDKKSEQDALTAGYNLDPQSDTAKQITKMRSE